MLLISCRACDHEASVEGPLETALCRELSSPGAAEPQV
jgi:hypothetical protein